MNSSDLLTSLAAAGVLLQPGWLLAHAARIPLPALAGFFGSALALFSLVLLANAFGLPLTATTLGGPWLLFTAVAFWVHGRRRGAGVTPGDHPTSAWANDWPLLLPLVPIFAVVIFRAGAQPLFGVDTIFRWNFLAEQMFAQRSLAFYPPVTPADFELYSWPDGIAPLVSILYFWSYTFADAARPGLTAPVVILQFVLLVAAAYGLGRRWFSPRAGAFGVALIAASPLVAWATAMGQETGLTALAVVGLLFYLPRTRAEESAAMVIAAGLAAGFGALAREYGLALPLFGLALGFARKLSRRTLWLFGATAALTALPWYARNWHRTGNPLFDLNLGGLFPANPVHGLLTDCFQRAFGWAQVPPEAPQLVAINALVGLLGLAAGIVFLRRSAAALLAAAGLVIAIWLASVGHTAAGFSYSLRVLSPALVLGAVLGGAALARAIPGRRLLAGVTLGLTLFAVDAALRTLVLPANVYRVPLAHWLTTGRALHNYHERPVYAELARRAGSSRLLVHGPNALLTRQGARTAPLWSPEVRFLFDAAMPPAEITRRLRAAGFGFVLLNTGAVNECFLAHSPFFRDPAGMLTPVWSDSDMVLLKINDRAAP